MLRTCLRSSTVWRRVSFASALVALGTVGGACDWGRFNKVKRDAPVVRLEPSDSYSGQYAVTLSTAHLDSRVELYVGGSARSRGGLVYSLGSAENPQPNPTDEAHCPGQEGADFCDTVAIPAGLNQATDSSGDLHDLCFVSGYGTIADSEGLWTRCEDGFQMVLPVPSDTEPGLGDSDNDPPRGLALATNRGGERVLLAATSAQARAWYYEPLTRDPIDVPTPTAAPSDFGARVAVAQLSTGYLFAISAPEAAQVWLYRAEGATVEPIGCLSGSSEFGRSLSTGEIDGDGEEDLLIADDTDVTAFSGASLGSAPAVANTDACEFDASVDDAEIARFICEATDESTGCGVSEFGQALAIADVDGDGMGEVFVGAPRMEVRGMSRAGAVLAYDQQGDRIDLLIVSDGDEGDELGASLAALPQGSREIVAVGATGSTQVFLYYCAAGSDGDGSERCK